MDKAQCSNCKFNYNGKCKRFPPQVVMSMGNTVTLFPEVSGNLWCGEYQMNKERATAEFKEIFE